MDCPHCKQLIYSRQHKHCGFCGGELPPELLLSAEEIAALHAEQAAIAARREADKIKEKERQETFERWRRAGFKRHRRDV